MSAPDAIAEARRRLADRPELEVVERDGALEVAAPHPHGFPVVLAREGEGFLVHYGGWHERHDAWRDAVHAFLYGVRGDCRLRVVLRGDEPVAWTLEHRRDGRWIADRRVSRLSLALWRKKTEVVLSNRR